MKIYDDPFTLLGLHRTASLEEVKHAYRRLAMRWHPDRNSSTAAEHEFKRIKAAYELILDPPRYAQWQQARTSATASARDTSTESTVPDDDVTQTLVLTLEEAAHGCVKSIDLARSTRCSPCHGSGRIQHTHSLPCVLCHGIGRLRGDNRGSRLCEACAGRGYRRETDCSECSGSGWHKNLRTLSVKVPAGILPGERLRLARQGRHAPHTPHGEGASGDLYLEIQFAPHALFELRQRDLLCTVPVSIFRLLCGGRIEVPTLSGTAALELVAGRLPGSSPDAEHGGDYCLPAQGFPKKHGRGAGDLVLRLQAVYPLHCGAKDRALLERLEASLAEDLAARAPTLATWEERLRKRQA